eukprot:TRINITY_DN3573_c0_g1_i3.p1 TRINITY_DN3573_c0_g1~~TRINITY_DN3573_c0_g1_i3.p1  ORF type:complete len:697 (+),score=157.45 TRINITY_DN3573_c0_g1_i3:289-2091(+)
MRDKLTAEINTLAQKCSQLTQDVAKSASDLQDEQERGSALAAQNAQLNEEVASLKTRSADMLARLEEAWAEVSEARNQVRKESISHGEHLESFAVVQALSETQQGDLDRLQKDLARLVLSESELQEALRKGDTKVASLEADLLGAKKEIAQRDTKIERLRVAVQEGAIEHRAQVELMLVTHKAEQDKMHIVMSEITDLRQKVSEYESKLSLLSVAVAEKDDKLGKLQPLVEQLQQRVDRYVNWDTNAHARLSALEASFHQKLAQGGGEPVLPEVELEKAKTIIMEEEKKWIQSELDITVSRLNHLGQLQKMDEAVRQHVEGRTGSSSQRKTSLLAHHAEDMVVGQPWGFVDRLLAPIENEQGEGEEDKMGALQVACIIAKAQNGFLEAEIKRLQQEAEQQRASLRSSVDRLSAELEGAWRTCKDIQVNAVAPKGLASPLLRTPLSLATSYPSTPGTSTPVKVDKPSTFYLPRSFSPSRRGEASKPSTPVSPFYSAASRTVTRTPPAQASASPTSKPTNQKKNTCAGCNKEFGWFTRRSDCKVCERGYCADCNAFNKSTSSPASPVRVCNTCMSTPTSLARIASGSPHRQSLTVTIQTASP